jgi:hypothetical protein
MPLSMLTIGTVNHIPGIRVALDTFREHHPDARLFTCLVDGPTTRDSDLALPGVVFSVDNLTLPGGRRFAFKFNAFELCCALKPFAASYVLEQYRADRLVYLDSDVMVFAPMDDCLAAGWNTARILCTPHFVAWPTQPAEILRQVRQYGTYNAGFFGVQDAPETRRFLSWWGGMCSEMGISEPTTGRFVDQIWLDLVVADRYGFAPILDPGMNVGYWNLSERILSKDGSTWRVNHRDLKFFHFSGFDSKRLTERRAVTPDDAHVAIAGEYAHRLQEAGLERLRDLPYGLGTYHDGSAIPLSHRRVIFRNDPALDGVVDPFKAKEDREIWQAMTRASGECPIEMPRSRPTMSQILDHIVRIGKGLLPKARDRMG